MASQFHPLGRPRSANFLPYVALVVCNLLWATDYPLYHILMPHYLPPIVLLAAALLATLVQMKHICFEIPTPVCALARNDKNA